MRTAASLLAAELGAAVNVAAFGAEGVLIALAVQPLLALAVFLHLKAAQAAQPVQGSPWRRRRDGARLF